MECLGEGKISRRTERVNHIKMILQECSEHFKDYRVVMVMDQAAWHRTGDIDTFENIRIICQPSYSPELNPVEHLWEYIRENCLRNWIR